MTLIRGFDSGAPATRYAHALAADGMKFAGRYLTRGDDWRTLHLPEVEALHAKKISIVCIFQHKNDSPGYFTRENASIDADRAITRAKALKLPAQCGIYFAVDTDVTAQNEAGVLEYAHVVWTKMQRTDWLQGWYGDDRVIKRVLEDMDQGHLAFLANAKGWRDPAIPDDFDILQFPQRKHPCGLDIDDCQIPLVDGDERETLRSVGAWLP
jgi:hypothetical protein